MINSSHIGQAIRLLAATCLSGLLYVGPVQAAPPCKNNVQYPRVPQNMCPETLIEYPYIPGIASITALTFGPDGSLYFARPATSEIIRLKPDVAGFLSVPYPAPQVFASHLPEPPNGLTYADGAWYVSGDTTITRLRDTKGIGTADEQQIIVRNLPGGVGGWLGNIHVGPDKRLYVAKGADCDACQESDPRRGALLSFALDGSDPRIVARGLRDSYDFGWQPDSGALYIVDNERPGLPGKLNLVPPSGAATVPDFGWPDCDLAAAQANAKCAGTIKPAATFEPDSDPTGAAFYEGTAFPDIKGKLLVALAGSWNAQQLTGYALMQVSFNANHTPDKVAVLLPADYVGRGSLADASLYWLSFYPDHPTGLAISPEGWIYLSVREGRIYRFRPRP